MIVAALKEHETLDEAQAYTAAGITQAPTRPLLVGLRPGHRGTSSPAQPTTDVQ